MDCEQSLHSADEDTDIAYVYEEDTAQVIDINDTDKPEALEHFDDLDIAENEMDEMDDGGTIVEHDDARIVFSKHTNSVLCICTDPKFSKFAVSGGQDDVAHVWQLTDGSTCFECVGHKDSVHCVGFSHDSAYIVTGDMKGVIKVWRVESKQEVFSFSLPVDESSAEEDEEDLVWLQWHATKYDLIAGMKTGEIYTWTNIPQSGSYSVLGSHGFPCTTGCYMPDGQLACAGYEDGAVKVWNLSTGKCVQTFAAGKFCHNARVTCLVCHPNNTIILTGSTDLTALLLNVKSGKVLTRFVCGDPSKDQDDSVEAIGISSCNRYIATATNFGMLTIWEADRYAQRHQCKHETGITKISWDAKTPVVYTATQGGAVFAWDARNGSMLSTWQGHSDAILDLCLTRNNSMLVTCSDDRTARVFLTSTASSQ